jgi:hypothetical protein
MKASFTGDAEKLIFEKRVTLRDQLVESPALNVESSDIAFIKVDGKVLYFSNRK